MRILLLGDLILDEPDPDALFDPSRELLRSADVVVGQVEVPHSRRGSVQSTDVPARPSDPENLAALVRAGVTVATLAGNHVADAGPEGIEDTIAELRALGIPATGAGMSLAEARTPALVEADGRRVGVLGYNCVGPRDGWARPSKAGCAYVEVLTHYELDHAGPGGPPRIFTFATPESLAALREDVAALRERADVVVVALHKGLGHVRARLAQYEGDLARAAIDAGADVVVGHHAHILRGIELHRGRPIFHGLGNFATVTRALSPANVDTPEAAAWARRRVELFGFTPDPAMPTYPFHPESRNTIVADCRVAADGSVEAGFVPCWIDDDARPVPLGPGDGDAVVAYVEAITREAGLATSYRWDGDRVLAVAAS
jgi:poly-gamma-glutamate synthesis protein (capsule biosynthesis protein)